MGLQAGLKLAGRGVMTLEMHVGKFSSGIPVIKFGLTSVWQMFVADEKNTAIPD
jgi:hypothetical protein